MLIALYTIFVLGGGSSFGPMIFIDEAMDNTKTVIVEKDRQKEVTASLKAMKKRSKDYVSIVKKTIKGLDTDSNPHDTNAEEIDAFWKEIFEQNARYSSDIIDMRFELRDQLSREEWEGMFPVPD